MLPTLVTGTATGTTVANSAAAAAILTNPIFIGCCGAAIIVVAIGTSVAIAREPEVLSSILNLTKRLLLLADAVS